MRLVVLTGGIACGKSTVAAILAEKYGIPTIDSDKIAHQQQLPGGSAYSEIVAHFGKEILNDDKTIDRQKLGAIVFADEAKRRELNRITHPKVFQELIWRSFINWLRRIPIVVLDIPLYFESHTSGKYFDDVICVTLTKDIELKRLMERNSISEEEATKRINAQMPVAEKMRKSTIVLDNSGSIEDLNAAIDVMVDNWRASLFVKYPDPLVILIFVSAVFFLARYWLSKHR